MYCCWPAKLLDEEGENSIVEDKKDSMEVCSAFIMFLLLGCRL